MIDTVLQSIEGELATLPNNVSKLMDINKRIKKEQRVNRNSW